MSVEMWNCQSWQLDVSTRGIYLIAYLGTPSHILYWSLHLTSPRGYIWQLIWVLHLTSYIGHFIYQVPGGISDSWSGYISHILYWSLHLTSSGGGGISDSWSGYIISHLILVTSSDKFSGGISDSLSGYFISHLILVTSSDKYLGGYIWHDCTMLTDCLQT